MGHKSLATVCWALSLACGMSLFACGDDKQQSEGTQPAAGTAGASKAGTTAGGENAAGVSGLSAGAAGVLGGAGAIASAGSSAAGAAAAAGSGGSSASDDDAGVAGAGGSAAAPMPIDDGTATWSNIYDFEFRTCKLSLCHGGGTARILMASKQMAYDSLVMVPALEGGQCAKTGKLRIAPGDPNNSLLYLKLDSKPPCGEPMPVGGQLPQKSRDRIRDWIMAGAKND